MYRKIQLLVGLVLIFLLVLLVQGCATLGAVKSLLSSAGSDPAPPSRQSAAPFLSTDYFQVASPLPDSAEGAPLLADSREECEGEIGLQKDETEQDASAEEGLSDEVTPEDNAIEDFSTARSETKEAAERVEVNEGVSRDNLMLEIINMLGVHYRFGGTNALGGIDCSAFVGTIYSRAVGLRLPRTSNAQFAVGKKIKKEKLLVGDLVFFKTRRRRHMPVSHVGIYVGENLFAHASRKQGVMISSLESRYYTKTYVGARRLVNDELTQLAP